MNHSKLHWSNSSQGPNVYVEGCCRLLRQNVYQRLLASEALRAAALLLDRDGGPSGKVSSSSGLKPQALGAAGFCTVICNTHAVSPERTTVESGLRAAGLLTGVVSGNLLFL